MEKVKRFILTAFFRGLGAVSLLILYFTIARFYTASESARWFFILTVSTITTPLMMGGLNTFSVKTIPLLDNAQALRDFVVSIFWKIVKGGVAVSAIGAVALLVIANVSELRPGISVLGLLALLLLIPAFSAVGFFFQGMMRYNLSIFILNICNYCLLSAVIIVNALLIGRSASTSDGPDLLLFISSGMSLALSLFLLAYLLKITFRDLLNRRASYTLDARQQSERYRFWVVLVLIYVTNWLPQIAYYFTGVREDYAYFSVAERLSNVINFFAIISNFFLAPLVSELFFKEKKEELRRYFVRITQGTSLVSLPVAAVLIVAPEYPLSLFGSDYVEGALYLRILAAAQLLNVVSGSVKTLLNMTGLEKHLIVSILFGLGLSVACILTVGMMWGGLGFAIAYAANIVGQNAAAAWVVYKRLGISVFLVFRIRV